MKWLHNLLKGLSLTTALFIFQACYGTPEGLLDEQMFFKVVEAGTDNPVEGAMISFRVRPGEAQWRLCGQTDVNGEATVWVRDALNDVPEFRFDATEKDYHVKDTVIADFTPDRKSVV